MTQKSKRAVSKGERLGWQALDKVKPVQLSSIGIVGRRVEVDPAKQRHVPFLIP